eukprot:GCRY01002775.1.p1 GENE.GCRY01002775.1~~GCRY01002775.1.p1  ORF type:complete len:360 (+),score=13.96 GCRY01002775.1:169-1248(+)
MIKTEKTIIPGGCACFEKKNKQSKHVQELEHFHSVFEAEVAFYGENIKSIEPENIINGVHYTFHEISGDFLCLLDESFLTKYIQQGHFLCIPANSRIDQKSSFFFSPDGFLHFTMDKDTYEMFGLVGAPLFKKDNRYGISIDLTAKEFSPKGKMFKRVCNSISRLPTSARDLKMYCSFWKDDGVPIDTIPFPSELVSKAVDPVTFVDAIDIFQAPAIFEAPDLSPDFLATVHDWSGHVHNRSECLQFENIEDVFLKMDTYTNSYFPELYSRVSHRPVQAKFCTWQGLFGCSVSKQILELVRALCQTQGCCALVRFSGFSDCVRPIAKQWRRLSPYVPMDPALQFVVGPDSKYLLFSEYS